MNGKQLSKKWNIRVKHALYRESGDWYHQLRKFPGALFDKYGYIIFDNEQDYQRCDYLQIQKDVHIKKGISSIPGYIKFVDEELKLSSGTFKNINEYEVYHEGRIKEVKLNKYERNATARNRCISHFGTICSVCEKNLEDIYGIIAKGIIHIHHILPLSKIAKEYIINPLQDLRPLCPNCHAVIHKRDPAYTIDELKEILRKHKALSP